MVKAFIKDKYKNAEKLPSTLNCAGSKYVPYKKYMEIKRARKRKRDEV